MFESADDFADYRLLEELWYYLRGSVGHYYDEGAYMASGSWRFGWSPTWLDLEAYIFSNWGPLRDTWDRLHPEQPNAWPPNWADVRLFVQESSVPPDAFVRTALDDVENAQAKLVVRGDPSQSESRRRHASELTHLSDLGGNERSVYDVVEGSKEPLQAGQVHGAILKRKDRGSPAERTVQRACAKLTKAGVFESIPAQGYRLIRKLHSGEPEES